MRKKVGLIAKLVVVATTTGCSLGQGGPVLGWYGSPDGYVRVTQTIEGDREGVSAWSEGENAKLVHTRMPETELTKSPYYRNRLAELADKVKGVFGKILPPTTPETQGYEQGS